MCEPAHSILQYPDTFDDGSGMATKPFAPSALQKFFDWGKKIGSFFHFSKMGEGHSEAQKIIIGQTWHEVPNPLRYEANWWDRKFHIDDYRTVPPDSHDCAKHYADLVSIGSLHALRQFLEASMKKTDRASEYFARFHNNFLNGKGRAELEKRFKSQVKHFFNINQIGLLLGFTRKRNLLVPEWADDEKLWVSS